MQAEFVFLLIAAAAALAVSVLFSASRATQGVLLVRGGTGLVAMAAIAAVPTLDIALLVLLVLAVLHASLDAKRGLTSRLRVPVLAVALLALGLVFARVQGPDVLQRFAAVGLVAGLAAAVGLLPYIHEFDPEDALSASPVVWIAFIGPVLASVVLMRSWGFLNPDAGAVMAEMLIGIGLLNVVWGSLGAWFTENNAAAWRYSFLADWGLALCGFGFTISEGRAAALLILFSVLLGRLPLYVASRQALRTKVTTERPINLVVAAALAGSAPFAGFAARVLLLRGATQLFWPLALVLAAGMLLWLPGSLRLGRTLGLPRGRQALGVAIVLVLNVAAGLYPQPILSFAGL